MITHTGNVMPTGTQRAIGRSLVALIALAAFVAFACDSNDNDITPTRTDAATDVKTVEASPSPTPAAPATPESSVTPVFDGGRGPVSGGDEASGAGLLVDVRAAAHGGFDRIVFEFEETLPGYTVEYVTPPVTACGSGLPVDVAGGAILQVRFYPANAHTEAGEPTLPSQEIASGLPSIVEAERACDFEAVVVWAIGLTQEADFSVTELGAPLRLVIDFAHP